MKINIRAEIDLHVSGGQAMVHTIDEKILSCFSVALSILKGHVYIKVISYIL